MNFVKHENIYTNRGRRLFTNAYESIKHLLDEEEGDLVHITYYDSNRLSFGCMKDLKEKGVLEENIFRIMEDSETWRIDDKREFSRIMKGSKYLPLSFQRFEDFNKVKNKYPPNKLWFIKSRGGTGGKSVTCKYTKDLNENPGDKYIIQEEIKPIDLWEKRKYVIRSYVLIWNKCAWLHKKALAFVHGKDYSENSDDFNMQVSHNGYWSKDGAVKVHSLDLINTLGKQKLIHNKLLDLLYISSKEICSKYRNILNNSTDRKYILLGIDSLPIIRNNDYDIKYVEVNRFPNICHTNVTNRDVNEKVLADMMKMFLNIDTPFNDFVLLENICK